MAAGGLGAAGSFVGGKAMRALGETMGLSEGWVRAMEAGGELGGGMLGGAAGVKGWRAGTAGWNPTSQAGVITKQGWSGGNPAAVAEVNKMPPAYRSEYQAARAAGWQKPDGSTWWPPENGAVPGSKQMTTLGKNTPLDRYGEPTGGYTSPRGTPFEQRAMPGTDPGTAKNYTVTKPLPVEEAKISPWFDQPGGGKQYRLIDPSGAKSRYSVQDAIDDGYLGDF